MEKVTTTNGNYYPIRDECKQVGDPKEGCMTTNALYYETKLTADEKVNIMLKHEDHIIFTQTYPQHIEYVYDIFELGCYNDKYLIRLYY